MPKTINIVEPTLMTEAGHCYSFIQSLCQSSDASTTLCLWGSRRAELAFGGANIAVRKHFFRKIRRFQSYFLYRKLLQAPGKVFVSTAGHTDLLLLDLASKGQVPPNKAYLYVHWFNVNERKMASLRALAARQPNLEIYGPTPTVIKVFQDAGFSRARVVPYPISQRAASNEAGTFRHVLFAGAARSDKGFSQVVDLIEQMHERRLQIPVVLQTSSEHGKYDAQTQADLQRLQTIGYPHLRLCPATLDAAQYADLFTGAVCLQLYDGAAFADRISGVTLDAFSAGSPVVSTPGSWIARMVQRFDAGTVVADASATEVLRAVQAQIADYARLSKQARAAGEVLQQENSAQTLYKLLAN